MTTDQRFDEISAQELMEVDDDDAALQAYAAHVWGA